ncbi:MAG: MBL fold metallo-hydrolase [Oscillospiraceae bacterium]|nr:MBL fold metallo-hydrolase [Oscillospiraceae bacterium]
MPKFHSLFSGSKGNASVIRSGGRSLLIDAGMTCKQLLLAMRSRDIDPCSISGILITHTHSDHIKGLRVLCKNIPAKVYATSESMSTLLRDGHITEEQFGGILDGNIQDISGFAVKAFPTEHDASGSCGFRIVTPDERTCSVCTDLGTVTDTVHNAIGGSDLVLLESNYDPNMLRNGSYPYYLKMRISGNEGHLSNRASAEEAERLIESGTTRLILGHLSEENNTPYLAERAARERLDMNYICGSDYLLYVAGREGLKETVIF